VIVAVIVVIIVVGFAVPWVLITHGHHTQTGTIRTITTSSGS